MTTFEIKMIIEQFEDFKREQQEAHAKLFQKIEELSVKVDPVVKIYTDISGTGRILKWIVITLTMITSLWLAVKAVILK